MNNVLNLYDLIHTLWNKMKKDQREQFLTDSNLDLISSDKLWGELDEVQQYMIVKWFYAKLGLQT